MSSRASKLAVKPGLSITRAPSLFCICELSPLLAGASPSVGGKELRNPVRDGEALSIAPPSRLLLLLLLLLLVKGENICVDGPGVFDTSSPDAPLPCDARLPLLDPFSLGGASMPVLVLPPAPLGTAALLCLPTNKLPTEPTLPMLRLVFAVLPLPCRWLLLNRLLPAERLSPLLLPPPPPRT